MLQADPDGTNADLGRFGHYFGIGGSPMPSFAIEIDTYYNGVASVGDCTEFDGFGTNVPWAKIGGRGTRYTEPYYDHISFVVGGQTLCPLFMQTVRRNNPSSLSPTFVRHVPVYRDSRNVEDISLCSRFSVVWDYISASEQRVRVFISDASTEDPAELRAMLQDNIISDYLRGNTQVWWGYSGATGSYSNEQTVCIPVTFAPPTGVNDTVQAETGATRSINVSANDITASNAPELWVSRIVTPPNNGGTASLTMNADQKSIDYRSAQAYLGEEEFVYEVCDSPNGDRCYARCTTAKVVVDVGCSGGAFVNATSTSANTSCRSGQENGAAEAVATRLQSSGHFQIKEQFNNTTLGDVSGSTRQTDGQRTRWSVADRTGSTATASIQSNPSNGRSLAFPPGSHASLGMQMTFDQPFSQAQIGLVFRAWQPNVSGSVELMAATINVERIDADGNTRSLTTSRVLSGTHSPNTPITVNISVADAIELGNVVGNYTLRITVANPAASTGTLVLTNTLFTVRPYSVARVDNLYTYRWYRGMVDATNLIAGINARIATGLSAGTYVVQAIETANNSCVLTSMPVEVRSSPPTIHVSVTEVSPVTSCGAPNGALRATVSVDGAIQTTGYTFSWARTRQLTTPLATGAEATGLSSDSYTVTVTETATGCVVSQAQSVSSSLTMPTITLEQKVDAMGCDRNARGSARLNSGGTTVGFIFQWYNGAYTTASSLPHTPQFLGPSQTFLLPGSYTARVVSASSRCPSEPLVIEIAGVRADIMISTTRNEASAVCTGVPGNGVLAVAASFGANPAGTSDFSFRFFRGPNTLPANEIMVMAGSPAHQRSGLGAGKYSVEATHTPTGCKATGIYTVANAPPEAPNINRASVSVGANTVCLASGASPANGSIDMSGSIVDNDALANPVPTYTYSISSSIPGFMPQNNATGIFTGLAAAKYFIAVRNNQNGCQRDGGFLFVEQQHAVSSITLGEMTADSSCNASGTGRTAYEAMSGIPGAMLGSITHELFRGANEDIANRVSTEMTSSLSHSFSGLTEGVYRIRVSSGGVGCAQTQDITIADEPFRPRYASPAADIMPNTSCVSPNGSVSVHLIDANSNRLNASALEEYTFQWYRGVSTLSPSTPLSGNSSMQTSLASSSTSSDNLGNYTVSITGPNGCETTELRTFQVPDGMPVLGVQIEPASVMRACVQSAADGSLEALITTGQAESLFDYEWYEGVLGASGAGFATTRIASGLWERAYSVRATHRPSGCKAVNTAQLRSTREAPIITLVSSLPNTACSAPYNGSATLRITYAGREVTDFSGFTFQLNLMPIPAMTALNALSPGTKALKVFRLGCKGLRVITTPDEAAAPDLSLPSSVSITNSRSCDEVASPSGSIRVHPNGSMDGTGYTYTWYEEPYSVTALPVAGINGHERNRLRSGDHSVRVESETTRCVATRDFVINVMPATVPSHNTSITEVTNCNPYNGGINVTLVGGAIASDYDWTWYRGRDDTQTLSASAGGVVLSLGQASGLSPGFYSFRYRERATSCTSELFSLEVQTSNRVVPSIGTSNPTLAGDCRGAEGVGRVTVNGPVGRRFDIEVYRGSHLDFSGLSVEESSEDQGTGSLDYDLPASIYTARVIERTSRCEQREVFNVGYVNAPTVVSLRGLGPSNCEPYVGSSGNGGSGGASGWVRVSLEVDASGGIDHDSYQLFLYTTTNSNLVAQANPLPSMTVGSMVWGIMDGRPRLIQSLAGQQSGSGPGASATAGTPPVRGAVGSGARVNAMGRMEREYVFTGLSGNTEASIHNYVLLAAEEGQTSCFSEPLNFNIPRINDEIEIPMRGGVSLTDNSSCGPTNTATGEITVQQVVRGSDPVHNTPTLLQTNYSFEWFEGATTTSPRLGSTIGRATAEVASGLSSGLYTLRITKITATDGDESGCSNTFTYAVNNNRPRIEITRVNPTHETSCGAPTGALEVTELSLGGSTMMFGAATTPDIEISVLDALNRTQGMITPSSAILGSLGHGIYTLAPRNTRTYCPGVQLQETLEDRRVYPAVNTANTSREANISCTSGAFTGSIDVAFDAGVVASDFNYAWKLLTSISTEESINSMNPLSNGTIASGFTTKNLTGLGPGSYQVNVTHRTSSCATEYTFAVPNAIILPRLNLDTRSATPNRSCDAMNPSGRIVVPASAAQPTGGNYSLALYNNPTNPLSPVGSSQALDLSAPSPPSRIQFNNLGASVYYLRLETPATGCHSPFIRQEVQEEPQIPQLVSLAITNDKGCNNTGLNRGTVDVVLSIPSGSTDTYDVELGPSSFSAVSTAVVPRLSNLPSGILDLIVLNTNNLCRDTARVDIGLDEPEFRIERLELTNQSHCTPNGSMRVSALRFNETTLAQAAGATSVYDDYTFAWTRRDGSSVTSSAPYEINRLEADTYNLDITHRASTCQVMGSFDIEDRIVRPLLRIMPASIDSSCQASSATGVLVATADNRDDVYDGNGDGSPDYSFNWYQGSLTGASLANTARIGNLVGGQTYTLEVRNVISGCVSTQEGQVRSRPIQPSINPSTQVSYTEVSRCVAPYNGALRVSGVSPGRLVDYNVRFYDNDPNTSPAPIQTLTNGNVSFTSLASQPYYLVLEHKSLGCLSSVYELMPSREVVFPEVLLDSYIPQTHCDTMRANGGMVVTATNGSRDLSLYRFDWLNEAGDTVAIDRTQKNDLLAGTYTIHVTLRASGCQSSRDFILPNAAINPLSVSFQTSENLRCVEPYSGTIIAAIDSILPDKELADYGFYWIQGAGIPTDINAEHRTPAWKMRQGGVYTVVAYDRVDPMCASLPTQVVLADNTIAPNPILEQVVPLTACAPQRANAELLLSFPSDPDQLRFHSYEWFRDNIDGDPLGITPELINVGLGTYVARITHKASGCSNTRMHTIEPAYRYPEMPLVSVERSRTDCDMPNGVARTTPRRGTTEDYSYEWFDQRDPSTLVDNRARADTLDVGIYNIFLTEYATGCRSQQAVSVEIFNAISKKRFNLNITPSLCTRPTGEAQIIPIDPFTIVSAEWTHQGSEEVFDAEILDFAPPGHYDVTALDQQNCRLDTSFVIPNIVKLYNGVSPNGDGRNDALLIDCIDNYPGSTISIYDRQGNPVFVQKNYDNTNAFRGIGNTGIYVGDKKLPDGTYYFVIEASDLEQPLSGYLELVQ